eukprot:TRINITY_DN7711_c0_g2_i3.p1 TRINITY_DN7711_c0_g2~~TRINITY_DN7711_c0_g2_i3.p1  ORF type:complete len:371 (+),score=92.25 TRINITY_DN7711_c0_g2_i3:47-1159(+)
MRLVHEDLRKRIRSSGINAEYGVIGEVIVVSNFSELKARAGECEGKIVLFNPIFESYGKTVIYRVSGASEAAKVGAIAALVRSIAPFSLYTPHTGVQSYEDGVKQIPVASVTLEDADMMARMQSRGQKIVVHFKMGAQTLPDTSSWNLIGDIKGRESPEEVVVLGGHTDSWDVGQGAIDDAGGFFSALHSVIIIRKLIDAGILPLPRRSIRAVLWVDEEVDQIGGTTYANNHKDSLKDHVIAFESDIGNFYPQGFAFSGLPEAYKIMESIGNMLSPIGVNNTLPRGGDDTDNGPLGDAGVPTGSLYGSAETGYYFYFHHNNADTITHVNREGLRRSIAAFGVFAYILADMEQRLPSKLNTPPPPSRVLRK